MSEHPLLIDGRWVAGEGERLTVLDKYHLTPFATVTSASPRQVTQMVEAAHGAYRGGAPLPYERGAILDRAAALVVERQADFVRTMQAEAGFTEADAGDRKSTRLNSSHQCATRMPSSAGKKKQTV